MGADACGAAFSLVMPSGPPVETDGYDFIYA